MTELRGIAFAGGDPVKRVMVSADEGGTWQEARVGEDLGRYSFREWRLSLALAAGKHAVKVRAETVGGEVQPLAARWQPAGYMHNPVETIMVEAV